MALAKILREVGIEMQDRIADDKPVYAGLGSDGSRIILKTNEEPNPAEDVLRRAFIDHEHKMHLAAGSHPNISRAHELIKIRTGERQHFVLTVAYIGGKPLNDKLPDFYASPEGDRLFFKALLGAVSGVQHMHAKGVLHGDIKPENIMVDEVGEGILIDLGAARHEASDYPGILSKFAIVTPEYAAPEQYRGASTRKTDAYQIGATILDGVAMAAPYKMGGDANAPKPVFTEPTDLLVESLALKHYAPLRNMLERARNTNPDARPSVDELSQMIKAHEIYFARNPRAKRLLPRFGVSARAPTEII